MEVLRGENRKDRNVRRAILDWFGSEDEVGVSRFLFFRNFWLRRF